MANAQPWRQVIDLEGLSLARGVQTNASRGATVWVIQESGLPENGDDGEGDGAAGMA